MKRLIPITALLLLLLGGTASATPTPTATPTPASQGGNCTITVSVTTASTVMLQANDISGFGLRHYLLVQNIGSANDIWCAMGTGNHCVSGQGFHLRIDDQWMMTSGSAERGLVPAADVCCVAANTSSMVTVCDW